MRYLLFIAAIVAAMTGYYAYWSYLADQFILQAELWIDQRRSEGYTISHEGFEVRGFPYRLTLSTGAPRIARPGDEVSWEWRAEYLAIYFQPWDFSHFIGVVEGRQVVQWRHGEVVEKIDIDARETRFSAVIVDHGQLDRVIAEAHHLTLANAQGKTVQVKDLQAALRINRGTDDSRPDGSVDVAIRVDAMDLPREYAFFLGPKLELFKVEGFLPAPLPKGAAARDAAQWRDLGGRLDIRDLAVNWGPLKVTGKGKFSLDEKLRPVGRLMTALRGYGDTLRAFAGKGGMSKGQATAAIFALNILARDDADGGRVVDTELAIRDGIVRLGPIALLTLPSFW